MLKSAGAARSEAKSIAAKPVADTTARKPATSSKEKAAAQAKVEAARKAEAASKAKVAATQKADAAVKAEAARKAEVSRKAEIARKPEPTAHKPETSVRGDRQARVVAAAPEKKDLSAISKVPEKKPATVAAQTPQPAPVTVKGVEAPVTAKPVTVAPAAVAAAPVKALKPAPTVKTNERETSGGDQKTMKNSGSRHGFKLSEFVVYPAHGVGQIVSIEEQEVAGFRLELFVINFVKDKMTLRVPVGKVTGVGMRKLSDPEQARRSLEILTGRARIKRTMWSRRAQEYEAKINSGDINAIAEVVRDLFRSEAQPEQSYSERQLYEAALDRMLREIAVVQKTTEAEAFKVIDMQLRKNAKRGVKPEGEAVEGEESVIEEAA